MKNIRAFAVLMLLSFSPVMARSEEVKLTDKDLTGFIATALATNSELKSSRSRWELFVEKTKQASALDDPMLMFKLQNLVARNPSSLGGEDPQTAKVIGISQQIPFWGKRGLKQEMAQHEAESYKWVVEERKLELIRMVKEVWYQLWVVDKSLQITEKNLRILADFVTIAESKYAVGQGVQQDIYKAGLEKSKMIDMQISRRQQRRSLEANFNALLYRPGNTPVGAIADFPLPQFSHSAEQLNEIALSRRPQLNSLLSLTNKGRAFHNLAEKEFYPDFNLSFEYMFRDAVATEMVTDPGDNMFTVALSFNLPFQQEKREAMLAEAGAETRMATEELNALKNTISLTINDALAQLDRRQQLIELYRKGIIPQAEQSLESALIGYRTNKVDFLALLDGRMDLFNYERELYESQADYMITLARLEAAVGGDIGAESGAQGASPPPASKQTQKSMPAPSGVKHPAHH